MKNIIKNMNILVTIFAILILSEPSTLKKVSAMNNNQNFKITNKNFNFSEDEHFDGIFKERLEYVIGFNLVENFKKFLLNSVDYIKSLDKSHNDCIFVMSNQTELVKKLTNKFKIENEIFFKNLSKNFKNSKINFCYYEALLFKLYDLSFFALENIVTGVFMHYVKNNKDYEKIPNSLVKYSNHIVKRLFNLTREKIHEKKSEKFRNIPKKYNSFEKYIKENNFNFEVKLVYCDIYNEITEAMEEISIITNIPELT